MYGQKIGSISEDREHIVIRMNGVSWVVGEARILRDIDWTVHRGEHWAVIGLNASGKTFLLNMVNGYIWPSEGEVSVCRAWVRI